MHKLIKTTLKNCPNDYVSDGEIDALLEFSKSQNAKASLIKRLVSKGELVRLKRGLFVLGEEYRRKPLNLYELSGIIYHPSYLGLHSALSFHGAIPESVYSITCITSNRSKEFKNKIGHFSYTHVNEMIFNKGIQRVETDSGSYLVSSIEKTILDYLYIHHRGWTNLKSLIDDLRIDPEIIENISGDKFVELATWYNSIKINTFASQLKKDLENHEY